MAIIAMKIVIRIILAAIVVIIGVFARRSCVIGIFL
jgi:hypothetical protein